MKDTTVRLTVRLPQDLHESLKEVSGDSDLSMNGEIVRLLRIALDKKLEKLAPGFWNLPAEERLSMIIHGFGKYLTEGPGSEESLLP
jgi:hypothetical protein